MMMNTQAFVERVKTTKFHKYLIIALIIYTPNQIHFPSSLGLPGVNVLNVICLMVWIIHLMSKRANDVKPQLRRRLFIVMGFMVYAFGIAQLRAPLNLMADITYVKTAIFYPLYFFLFFYVVRDEDDIRFYTLVILFVATLAAVEAIREAINYGITRYSETRRAAGPFGPNYTAANRAGVFYSMFFPLFLSIALFYKGEKNVRRLCYAGALLTVTAIFFTYSRQSYFIAALCAVILLARKGPFFFFLLVLAGLNYKLWVPEAAIQRLEGTQQVNEHGEEELDESTESRFELWAAGFKMMVAHPQGIGLNRFKNESGNYSIYPNKDAHNYYVLFAAEASPIAAIFHIILVISLFVMGNKLRKLARSKGDDFGEALGRGFAMSSFAMIMGNIYGSPFFSGEVMGLYWAMAGMVVRRIQLLNQGPDDEEKETDEDPTQPVIKRAL